MNPQEQELVVEEQRKAEAAAVSGTAKRVIQRFGRGARLKAAGTKPEPLDPLVGAKQLLELEGEFTRGAQEVQDAVMALIDDLYAKGTSLAMASRQLNIPIATLKERHLRWRERNPHAAHRVVYREKDPDVFLRALRAWLKDHKGEVPSFGTEVDHPDRPGEPLKLGYWVRNQRTARRAGEDRPEVTSQLDKLIPGWEDPQALEPGRGGRPRAKA